jgi:hypothetical protein
LPAKYCASYQRRVLGTLPVPESGIFNVPSGELVEILSVSLCGVASVGVNVTDTLHVPPAAKLADGTGHSLFTVNTESELEVPSISAASPLFLFAIFLMVIAAVRDFPTRIALPKFSALGA